ILGWVLYYSDLRPVPEVVLTAAGMVGDVEDATDSEGNYSLGPLEVGDYDVTLSRDASDLSAIDALDASDILRALVGDIQLSPDRQRVADVSGNGIIGTTDAALILRLLVGSVTSFPAGDFWQFEPEALQFRPLIQDEFRNFIAILLGDVNGDWEFAGAGKRLATSTPQLALDPVTDHSGSARAGLLLQGSDLHSLRAGVVELHYDPAMIRATRVRRANLGNDFLLATNLDEPGVVRAAFAGVESLDGVVDLLRVSVEEIGSPGATTFIDVRQASLNGDDLPPQSLARIEYRLGRLPADFDSDGRVDLDDLLILVDHLGTSNPRYDLDGTGNVSQRDMLSLMDQLDPEQRAKALETPAVVDAMSGIETHIAEVALSDQSTDVTLEPNHPNPFNSSTIIPFRLPAAGAVRLSVYDLTGQLVADLIDATMAAGSHLAEWDGRDASGRHVASGIYLIRLEAQALEAHTHLAQRKLLLLR
ncbi:MAG: T9SS type A sorting domain-containing protein, partial [Gemmatimonadetes bacterium]|nr:T9SS type A sorting domain-containing protein [Gemmatimonadota bacterium]